MGKIALVERFVSVQGEGRNAGRAALFIRLAGCNLRCRWHDAYCDTPWQDTREKITFENLTDWIQAEAIRLTVERLALDPDDRQMVVITGGEPTMAHQFDEIVRYCRAEGFYVAIETNGTIYRDSFAQINWVSCSPKGDVSQGNPFHGKPIPKWDPPEVDPKVRQHLERYDGEYRYVIAGPDDPIPEYHPAAAHYVSPAINSDGTGTEWETGFPGFVPGAVDRCLHIVQTDPRWRLSVQTHKFLGVR